MADYNSTYTGAEVDASVAKSQGIPSAVDVTSAVNKALALAPATDINEAIQPASASLGHVWTADGNGSATWAAVGGSHVYCTKLSGIACTSGGNTHYGEVILLSKTSIRNSLTTDYTTIKNSLSALMTGNVNSIFGFGSYYNGTTHVPAIGISKDGNTWYIELCSSDGVGSSLVMNTTQTTIRMFQSMELL